MGTAVATKSITNKEKEELIKEILGNKFSGAGNNLPLLRKIIDNISYADNVFSAAELVTYTNTLLTGSRFLSFIGNSAAVLSIFLSPVSNMIALLNAWQTGHKMYAYRAVAYTLTAWAFNETSPMASQTILRNIRSGYVTRDESTVREYDKAWRDTSKNVLTKIDSGIVSTSVPRNALKNILRLIADNNKQKLCEMLLRGFENQFEPIPRITWKNSYKIHYPH